MAYQVQRPNLVSLNGIEERLKLKLWKNDDPITSVCAGLCNNDQSVNVTKRKESQSDFRPLTRRTPVSGRLFVCSDLDDV